MSIFKSTFVPQVISQLNIRQNAIAGRNNKQLYQLNSRNAWIKMTSSVNINESSDPAKQYVLQGGILTDGKLRPGGIGNSYISYSSRGIRPMPGITMVDIKSKSAYGSLREATVSFSCNSIEQLEDLELLYMRPGYTVLLEWGWIPYLDNNGNLVSNITDLNTSVLDGTQTMEQVFTELFNRSKRLSGNYDALFGKVSNYNWSARPDGGYDCQTTLISIGEVIESLKVNSVPIDVANIVEKKGTFGFALKKPSLLTPQILKDAYSLNKLNGLLTELNAFAQDQLLQIEAAEAKGRDALRSYAGFTEKDTIQYDLFAMRIAATREGISTDNIPDSVIKTYITLESLTKLLNKYVLLSVQNGDKFQPLAKVVVESNPNLYNTGDQTPVPPPEPLLCLAHPYQVSVDVDVCVISNDLWGKTNRVIVKGATPQPTSGNSTKIETISPNIYSSKGGAISDPLTKFGDPAVSAPNYLATADAAIKSDYAAKALKLYQNFVSSISKFQTTQLAQQSFGAAIAILIPDTNTRTRFITFIKDTGNNAILFPNGINNFSQINEFNAAIDQIDASISAFNSVKLEKDRAQSVRVTGHLKLIDNATNLSAKGSPSQFKKFMFSEKDELGIIGNIYISIDMIQRLITSNNVGSDKREIQLYSFLKTIMSKVQESIGNVNNFDIHVDPADGNTGRIVDINLTIPKDQRKSLGSSAYEIKVGTVGPATGSIVRSYSLQSQIFPNQSSLIAIGSQVRGGGEQGTQNYTLLSFNKGLTDRNLPAKIDPTTLDKIPTEDDQRKAILQPSVDALNSYIFPTQAQARLDKNGIQTISETNKYKNALRDLIAYTQGIYKSPTRNSNIIPIQLSLTIDGIGGMIIGNIFKISENVLPKGYKFEAGSNSTLAQTVVGLSHKIENNDWTTTIEAYNIILDNNETEFPPAPNEIPPVATPSTTGDNTIPNPPFASNGLRYPFDGNFPTPTGFRQLRAGDDKVMGTDDDYYHGGLDIGIKKGTTIYAVDDGKVTTVTDGAEGVIKPAGGTQVVIFHPTGELAGLSTVYSHFSSRNVDKGDDVKKGQIIGVSGKTGRADGEHLHFEIRDYSKGIKNVASILDPGDYLPAFKT